MNIDTSKTVWGLTPLCKGDDDPNIPINRVKREEKIKSFISKWGGRKDYLKSPEVMLEALNDYEDLNANYGTGGTEGFYFHLRAQDDQTNPDIKAKLNKINEFEKKWNNELRFFKLLISKIPLEEQAKFLDYHGLNKYKHYLELKFKRAKYLLSDNEEKIISLKKDGAHDKWTKMVSGLLSKEEREILMPEGLKKKNFSEIATLIYNLDKKTRDSAAAAFNDIVLKYSDIAEAEINAVLENKKVDDELRKMPRPDSDRHLSDDIDSEVVDVLVDSVSKRFEIAKRYYALKAKLLGLKKLEYHEREIPYGDVEKKFTYDEGVDIVYKAFNKIDRDFAGIFKNFVENGRIDAFPKKGKKSGAYCSYGLKIDPVYISLNHTDVLRDVMTIAHESGHGINFEMSRNKQNALNFDLSLATAEVASTFMEDFALQEVLKDVDDETRLSIMLERLNGDVSTIFRQIACYKFEQELHKTFRDKGYLSKGEIGKMFQRNMAAYMGDAVEQSPGSENWWIHWAHIRRFFYNYSYASGLLISKAMQRALRGDSKFITKLKEFMSAGMSDSPKNIFAKMQIDITKREFWNSGIDEIENLLRDAENLAKKLGKI